MYLDSTRTAMKSRSQLLTPFLLTIIVLLLDQGTKALIVASIPEGKIGWSAFGDFLWLIHARNLGIAFSIGYGLAASIRSVLFVVFPFILVAGIMVFYFRGKGIDSLQRWALCGIAGGGLGNLLDRVLRPEGVVDFVSVKFYGLFGLERWPTFNVADATVVVCALLLAVSTLVQDAGKRS
jgi:signal peptidase II